MKGRTQLEIEGVSAFRAAEKLKRAEIPVFSVRKTHKNAITLEVESKDSKKVFAILESSCYNVKKVRFRGASRLWRSCLRSAGLLAGAVLFALTVVGMQTRVLQINVVGSGAYYEAEVLSILSDGGINRFGAMPADTALFTAEILSLPRVSFCSFRRAGGILTVEIEVSDENAVLSGEPLYAPAAGTVAELVVVRGTPCVQVGDEVRQGDTVVQNRAVYGETEKTVIVIARVRISYSVEAEYGGTEEEACAQALLDYGAMEDVTTEQTELGWRIVGTAFAEASVNLE